MVPGTLSWHFLIYWSQQTSNVTSLFPLHWLSFTPPFFASFLTRVLLNTEIDSGLSRGRGGVGSPRSCGTDTLPACCCCGGLFWGDPRLPWRPWAFWHGQRWWWMPWFLPATEGATQLELLWEDQTLFRHPTEQSVGSNTFPWLSIGLVYNPRRDGRSILAH